MTVWLAFLRAVNVGKRQMKMAELKVLCEELGYTKVKTLLASGNVRFECAHDPKAELEAAIEKRWGFFAEAVMRSGATPFSTQSTTAASASNTGFWRRGSAPAGAAGPFFSTGLPSVTSTKSSAIRS